MKINKLTKILIIIIALLIISIGFLIYNSFNQSKLIDYLKTVITVQSRMWRDLNKELQKSKVENSSEIYNIDPFKVDECEDFEI